MEAFILIMLIPVLVAILVHSASGEPCTICQNGNNVSLPSNVFVVPGFPPQQCDTIDSALTFLISDAASPDCLAIQSLGSQCGCPTREDSCLLCSNGESINRPENELPFFSELFNNNIPTCRVMESYLASTSSAEPLCSLSQSYIGEYCGCPDEGGDKRDDSVFRRDCSLCPDGEQASLSNRTLNIPDFVFQNCGQLEEAIGLLLDQTSSACSELSQVFANYCGCMPSPIITKPCSLCRDGSSIPNPAASISFVKDEFAGFVPTCAVFESYVAGFDAASQECATVQDLGSICGCPAIENSCDFCEGDQIPLEYYNKTIKQAMKYFEMELTCGEINFLQNQIPDDSELCRLGKQANFLCGCNGGIFSYFNADTKAKQAAFVWAPRITALLSIFGSLSILQDILLSKTRRSKMYSQIVLGISSFDLVGSIAWAFASAAVPEFDEYGESTYFYGANGNDATCQLQGFFIQLNYTSIFYNVSLSTYYLLVITYKWRDSRLRKNRFWFHGLPLFLGLGLAFGGIPFYQSIIVACGISQPPNAATWYPLIFLNIIPAFGSIFVTTGMLIRVCMSVRKQAIVANRWNPSRIWTRNISDKNTQKGSSLWPWCWRRSYADAAAVPATMSTSSRGFQHSRGGRGNSAIGRLETQVFIQSILYVLAFYITWSLVAVSSILNHRAFTNRSGSNGIAWNEYPFYILAFSLAPMQGFFNALIYFRPRLVSKRKRAIQARNQKRLAGRKHDLEQHMLPQSPQAQEGSIDSNSTDESNLSDKA